MKRLAFAVAALAVAALVGQVTPAKAATSVGVHIQIGDPYRGASIVFHDEPDVVLVPATKVYYVRDYDHDMYRYGRYWYFIEDGYWYRARSWRGPFIHIGISSVPRSIRTVPVSYRRHWNHGPPPHAVARGHYKNHDKHYDKHPDKHHDKPGKGRGR